MSLNILNNGQANGMHPNFRALSLNPKSIVTQLTSITTAVTANQPQGFITTVSSTLAAGVSTSFTVNCNGVGAQSMVLVSAGSGISGPTAVSVVASVSAIVAGSFLVTLTNASGSTLAAPVVVSYLVL